MVVLAVAALAPVLADLPSHVRVPVVVTEILAGIIVGPQVLDLAHPDAVLDTLSDFGLAFLFFMAVRRWSGRRCAGTRRSSRAPAGSCR